LQITSNSKIKVYGSSVKKPLKWGRLEGEIFFAVASSSESLIVKSKVMLESTPNYVAMTITT